MRQKEMRRKERSLTNSTMIEIMNNALYGVLSTVDNNGFPYGVPLNFVYQDSSIYFHCTKEGHKLDNIAENANVSFCVVDDVETIADKFTTKYKSVIAFGKAQEISGEKKKEALVMLIKKFSSDYMEKGMQYIEKGTDKLKVFEIKVENMNAKGHI